MFSQTSMEIPSSAHEFTKVCSTQWWKYGPVLALVSNLMLTPVLVFFVPKMTNPSPHPLFFKDLVQHISPIKNLLTQFTYFTFTQNMYKMELKGHIHTLVHKYFQVANNKLKITVAWQNEKKMAIYPKQQSIHWNPI